MGEEWWDGVESLPQGQLKLHPFPGEILAKAISMTHSGMSYRLDISVFYFMSHCYFRFLSLFFFFFNWDSSHARLNSHYEAWSYKKKSTKKITGNRKSV